jgi:hypothetical protein
MLTTIKNRATLRYEYLERRAMLAGDVAAELIGGALMIMGDREGNEIEVTQADGQITVSSPTTVEQSATIPHISIAGTGDGTFDYYSFKVVAGGGRGIFDIDFENFDTQLFLYDSLGNLLAENDDHGDDRGSSGRTASLIDYEFATGGTFIIGVGKWPSDNDGGQIAGAVQEAGDVYVLHISLENHPLNPSGVDAVLEVESNDPPASAQNVDGGGWNLDVGDDTTRINGLFAPATFQAAQVTDIVFTMAAGDDVVEVSQLALPGSMRVDLADGDDNLTAIFSQVGGDMMVESGKGDDVINLERMNVERNVSVKTGQGDDTVVNANSNVNGDTSIDTGQGDDEVFIEAFFNDSTYAGDVTIQTGQGDDFATVHSILGPIFIGGDVVIEMGQGDDTASTFALSGHLSISGSIRIDVGRDDDVVIVGFSSAFGGTHEVGADVIIEAGPGDDGVSVDGDFLIHGDLRLFGGPGDDGPDFEGK